MKLALLVGVALLGLSGCGKTTPEEKITRVVEEGAKAVEEKDAEKLCDLMSYQAKQWTMDYMQRANPQDCIQAAQEALNTLSQENRSRIGKTRPVRIEIVGRTAKVWISPRIVSGVPQPIPFTQGLGGWKAG